MPARDSGGEFVGQGQGEIRDKKRIRNTKKGLPGEFRTAPEKGEKVPKGLKPRQIKKAAGIHQKNVFGI